MVYVDCGNRIPKLNKFKERLSKVKQKQSL
nr:MAG TPA: hypothetical protein [Caudoviricetes sp.]